MSEASKMRAWIKAKNVNLFWPLGYTLTQDGKTSRGTCWMMAYKVGKL